jgi:uncharacterized damage-inducible protein DinB
VTGHSVKGTVVTQSNNSLSIIYEGWAGYNTSLIRAIAPLTEEQLAFRAAPGLFSVAEIARHIWCGRLGWFMRMPAPTSEELAATITEWTTDRDGNRNIVESALPTAVQSLVRGLEGTWAMIEATLSSWTVVDLQRTYRHTYWGETYAVSRQWTVWRILSHDMHHGGQLSMLLYMQGVEIPELGDLGAAARGTGVVSKAK